MVRFSLKTHVMRKISLGHVLCDVGGGRFDFGTALALHWDFAETLGSICI